MSESQMTEVLQAGAGNPQQGIRLTTQDNGLHYTVHLPSEYTADKLIGRRRYPLVDAGNLPMHTLIFQKVERKMDLVELFRWVQTELKCQEDGAPKKAQEPPTSEDETDQEIWPGDQRDPIDPYPSRIRQTQERKNTREPTTPKDSDPTRTQEQRKVEPQTGQQRYPERRSRENSADRDSCNICHKKGHWARQCPDRQGSRSRSGSRERPRNCWNCGDTGHSMLHCPTAVCSGCQGKGHLLASCPHATKIIEDSRPPSPARRSNGFEPNCKICGRTGHSVRRCFYNPEGENYRPEWGKPRQNSRSRSQEPEARRGRIVERVQEVTTSQSK